MSLSIQVLAIGKRMPAWVTSGVEEYARRMPSGVRFELTELAPGDRAGTRDTLAAKELEAKAILGRVGPRDCLIALDENGQSLSTRQWASELEKMMQEGDRPVFVIGGPDGLDASIIAKASKRWSLSKLTFPHPLVRVILVEQLYRALMICQSHPYHRD